MIDARDQLNKLKELTKENINTLSDTELLGMIKIIPIVENVFKDKCTLVKNEIKERKIN